MQLYARLFECPKSSFFLLGPRGTGKTTLVRTLRLANHEVSLLDEEKFQTISRQAEDVLRRIIRIKSGENGPSSTKSSASPIY